MYEKNTNKSSRSRILLFTIRIRTVRWKSFEWENRSRIEIGFFFFFRVSDLELLVALLDQNYSVGLGEDSSRHRKLCVLYL